MGKNKEKQDSGGGNPPPSTQTKAVKAGEASKTARNDIKDKAGEAGKIHETTCVVDKDKEKQGRGPAKNVSTDSDPVPKPNVNERIDKLELGMDKILAFIQTQEYEEYYEGPDADDASGTQGQAQAEYHEEEGELVEPPPKKQKTSLVAKLVQGLKLTEKTGESLSDTDLADTINQVARNKADEDKKSWIKDKIKQYPIPDNCGKLKVPRVDDLLWDQLESQTRSRDAGLQQMQLTLVTAITAVARATDDLIKRQAFDESLESELTPLMDAIVLLNNVNADLSLKRRELIKPDLNTEYKKLCSGVTEITDHLFGEDLAKQVKDIGEANKIKSKLSSSRGPRGSYARGRGYFRGRRPFQHHGGHTYFRGGWRGRGSPYYADKQFGRSMEYWGQGNSKKGATNQTKEKKQ